MFRRLEYLYSAGCEVPSASAAGMVGVSQLGGDGECVCFGGTLAACGSALPQLFLSLLLSPPLGFVSCMNITWRTYTPNKKHTGTRRRTRNHPPSPPPTTPPLLLHPADNANTAYSTRNIARNKSSQEISSRTPHCRHDRIPRCASVFLRRAASYPLFVLSAGARVSRATPWQRGPSPSQLW